MKKPVDIFIITFNQPEYFKQCVDSIKRNTIYPYRLTTYKNEKNEGVNTIFNRMIAKTDCDYFALMNDDVVLTKGWLSAIMRGFKDEQMAAVAPKTSWGEPQQIDELASKRFDMSIEEIEEVGRQRYNEKNEVREITRSLNGCCWVLNRKIYDKVGKLNEELILAGHETEYCNRVMKLGYKLGVANNAYVHHYGSVSINKAVKDGILDRKIDIELAHKLC